MKIREQVITLFRENPKRTACELADLLGLTEGRIHILIHQLRSLGVRIRSVATYRKPGRGRPASLYTMELAQ